MIQARRARTATQVELKALQEKTVKLQAFD